MSFAFSCSGFPIFAHPCDSSRSYFPVGRRCTNFYLHLRKDLFPSVSCERSSSFVDLAETPEATSAKPQILEEVVLPVEDNAEKGSISPPGPGDEIYEMLPFLINHREHLDYRFAQYKNTREMIDEQEGGLEAFSRGYEKLGFNRSSTGITYREWAPAAKSAALVGDFNNWNPSAAVMTQNEFGIWELFLPNDTDGSPPIPHGSRVKIRMDTPSGIKDSIPAWIKFSVQAPGELSYSGIYYDPPVEEKYVFKHPRPEKPRSLRIYEALIGISNSELKINTYATLRDDILPRIKKLGYNAVQLTAIQEHSCCVNSGYHVTNFFAPSSRCGTPDDLKSLVDKAHELGLFVLMDIVHSHASNNVMDGLNMFDGTDSHYFHSGSRGYHDIWESRLFNYGDLEVLRFLISNARWWLEEYRFDGFRFDGVTSMMYTHHGLQVQFTGSYKEYFGSATDVNAMVYLMLVNDVVHGLFPEAITLGEDASGMPTFGFPVQDGGVGFDYRMNTSIAEKWIEILKKKDNDWQMDDILSMFADRRWSEKCIAYAGSHDQALLGENTLAFCLMDKDMHGFMALDIPSNPVIERGIALHKMIRLITMGLSEGYLNFMGNEFGHPGSPSSDKNHLDGRAMPWNDTCLGFDLGDADNLRYRGMKEFDRAMQHLEETYGFLTSECEFELRMYDDDSVISFVRGDLVFVFNFHWKQSYSKFRVGCSEPGKYRIVLDSDHKNFGGLNRIDWNVDHLTTEGWFNGLSYSFVVNSPCRTAVVYALVKE